MSLNILKSVQYVGTLFLDLLFPVECVGCGKEDVWLCEDCFNKISFQTEQVCPECKTPTEYGKYCLKCNKKFFLDAVLVACEYEDEKISLLIKLYKYNFIKEISLILGKILLIFFRDLEFRQTLSNRFFEDGNLFFSNSKSFFDDCLLVPVPLHQRRKLWRGFNQSEEIAQIVTNNFNLDIDCVNLVRNKYTKPQTKLNKSKRQNNLNGCFEWRGKDLKGKKILLVDDVVSTGTTLNECAKVLKLAGASEVWGIVIARN